MGFHLYLIIVLGHFVLSHLRQTRVLDQDPGCPIFFHYIAFDQRLGIACSQYPTPLVLLNDVISDYALRLHQYYPVMVTYDFILFHQQLLFPLDNENAFAFRVLYQVVLDFRVATILATQSYIRFYVLLYLIRVNLSVTAFHYQNALVVVG